MFKSESGGGVEGRSPINPVAWRLWRRRFLRWSRLANFGTLLLWVGFK